MPKTNTKPGTWLHDLRRQIKRQYGAGWSVIEQSARVKLTRRNEGSVMLGIPWAASSTTAILNEIGVIRSRMLERDYDSPNRMRFVRSHEQLVLLLMLIDREKALEAQFVNRRRSRSGPIGVDLFPCFDCALANLGKDRVSPVFCVQLDENVFPRRH